MKKYIVTCLIGLCTGLTTARSPFKCTLYDRENNIWTCMKKASMYREWKCSVP